MNIIIPCGGIGARFLETGYTLPKPLINLLLKPILFWLLDCLEVEPHDNVIIVCNKRLKQYRFRELIRKEFNNVNVVYLGHDTCGAAETVLYGLNQADLSQPTILLDSDTFYNIDILKLYRRSNNKNVIFSFKQQDSKPLFSYVRLDNDYVVEIAEKKRISKFANTGAYGFETGKKLKQYCQSSLKKFDKLEQNEVYTSHVIQDMINDGHLFKCVELLDTDFEVVGTPLQFKLFHNKHKDNKKHFERYRVCFDLDNTLVTHPTTRGDYSTVQPIESTIQYTRFLHELGCTVIIYTARRMKTHNGNVGAIVQDVGKTTLETIEKYDIPCDELYFGKPYAHAYIDDLAHNVFDDYPFRLGLMNHHVKERDFNTVRSKTLQVFEKQSINLKKLQAEVFWYENIPEGVRRYTPKVLSKDLETGSYLMEKIDGITFSELLIGQSLNESMFTKVLEIIDHFHQYKPDQQDIDLYSVYASKLEQRFNTYDYSKFTGAEEIYNSITDKLNSYRHNDLGIAGCIHGDPVFSNILIDKDSIIKLVDPRGLTAKNELCIYGDVMYDYGKILQSLYGYDEILLTGEKFLDNSSLIKILNTHVKKKYGSKYVDLIECIKNSLLFSLIPLHDNNNCKKYFELITK